MSDEKNKVNRKPFVLAFIGLFMIGYFVSKIIPQPLKLSGTLEMTEHSLGAKVPGRIENIYFKEGEFVSKGKVLATLDRYEQAKKDYERMKALFEEGGTDHQSLEHALLAVQDQTVVSPVDATILLKVRQSGEIVSGGGIVAIVGDTKNLWVRIFIPEGKINQVKLGQEAKLKFDGVEKSFKGHVIFISPRSEFTPRNVQTAEERVTQTFAVKVALDDSPTGLHPGVFADVDLNLKK